ncbi:SAM-dependent methyltransferase [Fictibacillus sp. NPDC058756]|uniref:SAM-dependent methyltransferase n=1 Tax=Fictibacillus sp. NPDC058756 TaxID=3346625 RepID=UPI0036A65AD9
MSLNDVIKRYLDQNHWMTMEQFMELALYHPEYGYYMSEQKKIGKNGDFYTSSSVSDVFGKVWADVFAKTIHEHKLDPIVVEFGAGTGRFAKQVLSGWKDNGNGQQISYIIVEKSPYHRQLLQNELTGSSVIIFCSFEELKESYPDFKGIIFANEVLDAFPLRIFLKQKNDWFEKVVILDEAKDEIRFNYINASEHTLLLDKLFASRRSDFELEVSLQMMNWLNDLYEWTAEKSIYFFVDYGYRGEEWNREALKEGSIRGYHKHKIENNTLSYPGKMDITYHVNWDQVENAAKKQDVETIHFSMQGEFLLKEGILLLLNDAKGTDPFSAEHKRNRAIRSFLLDSTLANGFQVMKQQKKRTVL